MFCLSPLPNLLCHFPFAITGTYSLPSTLIKHTHTQCVFLTWRWRTSLYCLWGCRCLLLLSVWLGLSSLPVRLSIPFFLALSCSSSSCLVSLPALPLHLHIASPPPLINPSYLPSFRLDFFHVSLIFLSFLYSSSPSLSLSLSLLSPVSSSPDRYHSSLCSWLCWPAL